MTGTNIKVPLTQRDARDADIDQYAHGALLCIFNGSDQYEEHVISWRTYSAILYPLLRLPAILKSLTNIGRDLAIESVTQPICRT